MVLIKIKERFTLDLRMSLPSGRIGYSKNSSHWSAWDEAHKLMPDPQSAFPLFLQGAQGMAREGWSVGGGRGSGKRRLRRLWCGGGVVVVWCEVVMGFWGFRSFLLLCHNAQLFNQKLSTELLNLQYELVPLSSGQAPSLPKLSDSLLLWRALHSHLWEEVNVSFCQPIQLICGLLWLFASPPDA